MSKAKELAREVLGWHHLSNTEISLSLCKLADAVLSEPEEPCGLKGWIENGVAPHRVLLHLATNKVVQESVFPANHEKYNKPSVILYVLGELSEDAMRLDESYDSIKRKIKEAS